LLGHASEKFQRIFSAPVSSRSTMEPFFRSGLPSTTVCRHFHNSSESVIPRLSVMAENVFQAWKFGLVVGMGALAIIDRGRARIETADFLKARLRDAVELDQEIETAIGVNPSTRWHDVPPVECK